MKRSASPFIWVGATALAALGCPATAPTHAADLVCGRVYTLNADFDEGTLLNVNHSIPDQLQLNADTRPFPFLWVACSGRGTIARIDVNTGVVLGEYWSSPLGRGRNPSRTTVDLDGNVWVGNRDEGGLIGGTEHGSVIKIGLVIGGTRVDGAGNPDPNGEYLQPPFLYSTAVDRDGDGLIKTSRGLGHILAWPDITDGGGGAGGGAALVEDADDECILVYQRLPDAPGVRHVSVTRDNDVWVGGYPYVQRRFFKLSGNDGSILDSFDARPIGAGGYGGFIDAQNVLWSASISQNQLLRYDLNTHPAPGSGLAIGIAQSYGLGVDSAGFIWNAMWTANTVAKLSPAGILQPGFPVPTGGACSRGVAVTLTDNHVWIANSCSATVTRLDNAGNLLTVIPVGGNPTGVAVDANGKVWVTCHDSSTAERIDPAGAGGLGAVDLIAGLGGGAYPYNYSDMTGNLILGVVQQGTWTVVHDCLVPATDWGTVSWTSAEPLGTSVKVRVRAADSVAGLPALPFLEVGNGANFCDQGVAGQYLEVQAVFGREPGVQETPILYDLTLQCCNRTPVALCQDIQVCTDPGTCAATVVATDVDAGSYDPDGDPITLALLPPGPYPLGDTVVTLTVTDPLGETDHCDATITVLDCEPPSVVCTPTTNPAGTTIPPAGTNPKSGQNPDGFYQLLAADHCDPSPAIYIADSASGFVAGPFASGDKVKITQAPGVKPRQLPGAGVLVAHVILKGDAVVVAVDTAGNRTRCTCLVPPPPK